MKQLAVCLLLLGFTLGDEEHAHATCRRSWEKIACFTEAPKATTLWTDRGTDRSHNHTIDWKNYKAYLFELACRCKTLAEAKGFRYFGLRNFGDCTGIANLAGTFRYSDSDPNCVQEQFKDCNSNSESECIGRGMFEYVYKIGIDGGWTPYEDWTPCDKSCGEGLQRRKRTCSNPYPSSNGAPCEGAAEETRSCNQQPCAVNGGWTAYGDWGTCDKTCGEGFQSRRRTCSNPLPSFGGRSCEGAAEESRSCNERPCAVNGGWTAYGDWGTCDKTCGGGVQSRRRTCSNPVPSFGGAPCEGAAEESRSCNQQPCAVNGGWTTFGDWGSCDKTCGGGVQSRKRTCSNPSPSFGGAPCEGAAEESRSCNQQPCAVNGGWTAYGDWGTCDKTCGGGLQSRRRTCSNPLPSFGGTPCEGATEETRSCNGQPCIDFSAPQSECNFVIGDGIGGSELHLGQVENPKACVAACLERQKSDRGINGASVDGFTGRTCYCKKGMTRLDSTNGWRTCLFGYTVDGGWTDFSQWSSCSQPCNGGTQWRTRSCSNPSPSRLGNPCVGEAVESRICNQWTICADAASSFPGCELNFGEGIGGSEIIIGTFADPKACAAACFQRSKSDRSINGVTLDAATGKICYCEKGMTGSTSSQAWRTCKFADSCNFVNGDGVGGSEINIGSFADASACVAACSDRRKGDPSINGVTVDSATGKNCYCERGMTGVNGSPSWKTCKFL